MPENHDDIAERVDREMGTSVETKSETAVAPVPDKIPDIAVKEDGVLAPSSIKDLIYLSRLYHQSGAFSKSFASPQAVFVALQMSVEMGISPAKALNWMYVVNGRVNTHSGGPLALVQSSGLCEEYDEYLIDKDYRRVCVDNKNLDTEPFAAVCISKRKDKPSPMVTYFTVKDAHRADLSKKNNWKQYPGRMLLSKARQHNLSYNFADAIGGLETDVPASISSVDATDEAKAKDMDEALKKLSEAKEKEDAKGGE